MGKNTSLVIDTACSTCNQAWTRSPDVLLSVQRHFAYLFGAGPTHKMLCQVARLFPYCELRQA